jgi:MarR family transcriptional regulator for hemolysin
MQLEIFERSRDAVAREEFGFRLGKLSRWWRHQLDENLKPLDLTQARWVVLLHLDRGGDGLLQKQLAEYIGVEGPSLVRTLDALEERGLIERRTSPEDRRGKTVHLTRKGRKVNSEIHDIAVSIREDLLNGISETELRACLDVFDRIRKNTQTVRSTGKQPATSANNKQARR